MDDRSAARELVLGHLGRISAYHAQKENMTWSAATLYAAAISVLLASGRAPFWHHAAPLKFWLFVALLAGTAFVAFKFVEAQFAKRASAHLLVVACGNVAARWASGDGQPAEYESEDLRKANATTGMVIAIDFQLMPRAVIDELARIVGERQDKKSEESKGTKKAWAGGIVDADDRRLTRILMWPWTAAGLVRLLTGWDPIARCISTWPGLAS